MTEKGREGKEGSYQGASSIWREEIRQSRMNGEERQSDSRFSQDNAIFTAVQ